MAIRKKPGRPPQQNGQDTAEAIVAAACRQFARHGIKGGSKRAIAADAGVTPALVHYYFHKNEDLHLAVVRAAFDPLVAALANLREPVRLDDWARAYHDHLSARPWLPHLMIREVLTPNGELREHFLRLYGRMLFARLKSAVAHAGARRKLRKGFDMDRHVVLLVGLLNYPFLVTDLAQDVTGRKFDRRMLEGFREDALKLFRHGIGAR